MPSARAEGIREPKWIVRGALQCSWLTQLQPHLTASGQPAAAHRAVYWSGVTCAGIGCGGLGIASPDGGGGIASPDGGGIGSPDGGGIGARDNDADTGFGFRGGAAGSCREDAGILLRISWLADCNISIWCTIWP